MALGLWPQLPPDIEARIFDSLPPNDIACNIRLVNKSSALKYSTTPYTVVHLSQPVPSHAFKWRWTSLFVRALSCAKRRQLLHLTAASGVLKNLEAANEVAGLALTGICMEAAAAAGHVHICQWLRQQGCKWGNALDAGAGAGRLELCRWLLAQNCDGSLEDAQIAAIRGGHVSLTEKLESDRKPPVRYFISVDALLKAGAEGADLAFMTLLMRVWLPRIEDSRRQPQDSADRSTPLRDGILAAAARSRTIWQEKIQWLESQGFARIAACSSAVADLPDAVERLSWLRQRGYPVHEAAVTAAARCGNTPFLEYLLDTTGLEARSADATTAAAAGGHLPALQLLYARGCPLAPREAVRAAALGGHMAAVVWLVETVVLDEGALDLDPQLTAAAAESGSMELLRWLSDRGALLCDPTTLPCAARGGCKAVMKWLVERGCPVPGEGSAYVIAASNGDLSTMRCLRKLGCPWDHPGGLFAACAATRVPQPCLSWLLGEGCPVDWQGALRAVGKLSGCDRWDMEEWLMKEWEQHEGPKGA